MFILDSYDGVTAAACFSANHVPCAALHELIRIVKPGELFDLYHDTHLSQLMRLWHLSPSVTHSSNSHMRSHPVGLDVRFFIGPFVSFHTSCVRTAKALARLRGCEGSPEPSLAAYVLSTIISFSHIILVTLSIIAFSSPSWMSVGFSACECFVKLIVLNALRADQIHLYWKDLFHIDFPFIKNLEQHNWKKKKKKEENPPLLKMYVEESYNIVT